uniref:Uncharacterized protein n=1 Tax=Arundo donax TaxID=35708 RepID=A0A0A8ZXN6_ARUDO
MSSSSKTNSMDMPMSPPLSHVPHVTSSFLHSQVFFSELCSG